LISLACRPVAQFSFRTFPLGFFEEEIELSGRRIFLNLLVPGGVVLL